MLSNLGEGRHVGSLPSDKGTSPHILSFLQKGTAGYNVFSRPLTPQHWSFGLGSVLAMLEKPLSPHSCQSCQQGTSLLTRVQVNGGFSPMLPHKTCDVSEGKRQLEGSKQYMTLPRV